MHGLEIAQSVSVFIMFWSCNCIGRIFGIFGGRCCTLSLIMYIVAAQAKSSIVSIVAGEYGITKNNQSTSSHTRCLKRKRRKIYTYTRERQRQHAAYHTNKCDD